MLGPPNNEATRARGVLDAAISMVAGDLASTRERRVRAVQAAMAPVLGGGSARTGQLRRPTPVLGCGSARTGPRRPTPVLGGGFARTGEVENEVRHGVGRPRQHRCWEAVSQGRERARGGFAMTGEAENEANERGRERSDQGLCGR